jgi:hypothetical protein
MTTLLGWLLDAFKLMGVYVLYGVETAINAVIAAVGVSLGLLFALLPSMPDPPDLGGAAWLGWLNAFVPVTGLLTGLAVFIGLWVAFLAVRIPLRWVKGL